MQPVFDEVLKKSQTLSRWTREYIDTINVLEGAWNRLISLFDNHQHIMAQQVFLSQSATLKVNIFLLDRNNENKIEHRQRKYVKRIGFVFFKVGPSKIQFII